MKKTRFTESQIIGALKQYENGRSAEDICRELGISRASFLHLEKEVWRDGSQSAKGTKGASGGESQA